MFTFATMKFAIILRLLKTLLSCQRDMKKTKSIIHRPLTEIVLRNQSIEQQEPTREESEVDVSEALETVAVVGEQIEGGRDIEETQEPEDPLAPIREVNPEGPCYIF